MVFKGTFGCLGSTYRLSTIEMDTLNEKFSIGHP